MPTQIRLRRDTAANWTTANPVLAAGEAGVETDTGKLKIGNGSSSWTQLSYLTIDASQVTAGTLGSARIPNLDAAKVTSGTFDAARIPNTDASKVTNQQNLIAGQFYSGGLVAGGARKIFVQSTQPSSGMSAGDLWFWGS